MKILKINQYIEERMKVMPINNDEFDKVSEYTPRDSSKLQLLKISNPEYKDILVPGNIVLTNEMFDNVYICFGKFDEDIHSCLRKDIPFLTHDEKYIMVGRFKETISYTYCYDYYENFPRSKSGYAFNIKSVYHSNINVSELKSKKDFFETLYKIYQHI